MNQNSTACSLERIEQFFTEQLSDDEQAAFESHLDDCSDCRQRLEASAGRDEIWSGVRDSLRHEHSGRLLPDDRDRDATEPGEFQLTHDPVLGLLAPTDDERMLGRLGTYEVMGIVGSGGMGVVLKAFDAALNRYVAIKLLAPHLGSSGAARKRFSREARAAAAVVHDNVIEIHGVAEVNGLPYLVMPYVRGPSLQRRIDRDGPLGLVEILRIGQQAASGLAAAHAQGLVHRDVKPANILLADGIDRVKLTDFGLARAADDASLTHTGIIAGTPQYMSPEQARGESVDQRSDLFSLGSVLYAMCTGRAPFRAETSYGVLRRITDAEPRPIREINPDIPPWLCQIIARLMSKRPEDRFGSAREVADLLERCLAHVQHPTAVPLPVDPLPPSGSDGPVAAGTSSRSGRRSAVRRLTGIGFAFALILAGVLIVLELNKGQLRIESEADDVPLRIMEGDEVVERLTVTRSGASTRIAAGRYVVVVDGEMDGIAVENGTVTLERGGDAVVRIVRDDPLPDVERARTWSDLLPAEELIDEGPVQIERLDDGSILLRGRRGDVERMAAEIRQAQGTTTATRERDVAQLTEEAPVLYQGATEAVWKRRFAAETNPVAKIEAGKALVALTGPHPTERWIPRVTQIGGELLRDGWGPNVADALSPSLFRAGFDPPRWPLDSYPNLEDTWKPFIELAASVVLTLPPERAAEQLAEAAADASPEQAVFAAILLQQQDVYTALGESQAAADAVVDSMRRPEDDRLNRLYMLVRSYYFEAASPAARDRLTADLRETGETFAAGNLSAAEQRFARAWYSALRRHGIDLPGDLEARVVLQLLLSDPRGALREYFHVRWMSTGQFAYPDEWMKQARERGMPLWDHWIGLVNRWLAEHPEETEETAAIIGTLDMVLRAREASDDWNVDTLVRRLSERLERRYADAGSNGASKGDTITSTHDLLSYIVLAGGELPEFVSEHPPRQSDAAALDRFKSLMNSNPSWNEFQRARGELRHLMLQAPYHTVRIAIEGTAPPEHVSRLQALAGASSRGNGDDSPPPIEPLLLLAVATDLTGVSEEQDERIASLFPKPPTVGTTRSMFARHIDDALDYPFAIRLIAEKWLRRMYERSRSEELSGRLEELMPALKERDRKEATQTDNAPGLEQNARRSQYARGKGEAREGSPEFPAVRVAIQSRDGQPVAGTNVKMRLLDKDSRPVVGTGDSGADGIAIDRALPYGKYYLSVRTADGWVATSRDVEVEFGRDFNLTIVPPEPDRNAALMIDGRFRPADLSGLRFGNIQFPHDSGVGYSVYNSPEPGAGVKVTPNRFFTTFPRPGDGIDEIALTFSVKVYRETEQPDGTELKWSWAPSAEEQPRRFLLTTETVYPVVESDGGTSRQRTENTWFAPLEGKHYNVGYVEYTLGEPSSLPLTLSVPAGRAVVYITSVVGRPGSDVREALGVAEPSHPPQIWLSARLKRMSDWIPRLLDVSEWKPNGPDSGVILQHLVRREETLDDGETLTLRITPPLPENASRSPLPVAAPDP